MSEATLTTLEVTNACTCVEYDDEGEAVLDADGDTVPSDYCHGWCWDETMEDFRESILSPFLDAIGADSDSDILVEGTGMGWQGRAGWIIVTASDLHDALAINGEYRVDYRFDGTDLTAVRYSHDEPTGTGTFRFSLAPADAE